MNRKKCQQYWKNQKLLNNLFIIKQTHYLANRKADVQVEGKVRVL